MHTDKGQVNSSAAEVYEERFIPALFQDWPDIIANLIDIQSGQRVLDVACGTGILARTIAKRIGSPNHVVGLDVNKGMLTVAKRKNPHIKWRQGQAEDLPFNNASFDAVVSQFGLMFFEDRRAAIQEMARVLKPGGCLAVAVWDSLENTPGYAAMVNLLQRLFGDDIASGLKAPYNLGDTKVLQNLFTNTSLTDIQTITHQGTARFPSIESWVYTDIKGWVLDDMLDDNQIALLLKEAERELSPFVTDDGRVAFSTPAHIVTAAHV